MQLLLSRLWNKQCHCHLQNMENENLSFYFKLLIIKLKTLFMFINNILHVKNNIIYTIRNIHYGIQFNQKYLNPKYCFVYIFRNAQSTFCGKETDEKSAAIYTIFSQQNATLHRNCRKKYFLTQLVVQTPTNNNPYLGGKG